MCDKVSASATAMPAIVKLEKIPGTKGRSLLDMAKPMKKEEFEASFAGFGDEWREIRARTLKKELEEKNKHKRQQSNTALALRTHRTPRNYWSTDPSRVKPTVTYQTGVREEDADGTQNVYPVQG